MKISWSIFSLCLLLVACSPGNLKKFYFQLDDFAQPVIYEVESSTNPSRNIYFRMSVQAESNELFTEIFDYQFNLLETFSEEFDEEGAKVTAVSTINQDIGTTVLSIGKDRDVFIWKPKAPFSYSFSEGSGPKRYRMKRTRTFEKKEKIKYGYGTILSVNISETWNLFAPTGNQQLSMARQLYYGKDKGLVRMDIYNGKNLVNQLTLTRILTEAEWKELQKGS